jgi:hypothetical protein
MMQAQEVRWYSGIHARRKRAREHFVVVEFTDGSLRWILSERWTGCADNSGSSRCVDCQSLLFPELASLVTKMPESRLHGTLIE